MLRNRLQLALADAWQRRGVAARALAPLAALYYLIYLSRGALYAMHVLHAARLDVPVVVVGNLYVGGTGKTPLTVELVRALIARGWRPGIVSRGYGAQAAQNSRARLVRPEDAARRVGDEPLLMVRATTAPLAIGKRRVEAAQLLLAAHPECDVIVADDGLQHLQLARDMEIALLDHRGLGNGWLLPAGPLREPRRRLDRVDAIALNGDTPEIAAAAPRYRMRTHVTGAFALHDPRLRIELASLAAEQRSHGWRLTAAAGIGAPDRFFAMLRAAGLAIETLPLADHFDYQANPFSECVADRILITEKDAVKCADNSSLANDPRLWVVPLVTEVDPALIDAVIARISAQSCARKNADGPSPA